MEGLVWAICKKQLTGTKRSTSFRMLTAFALYFCGRKKILPLPPWLERVPWKWDLYGSYVPGRGGWYRNCAVLCFSVYSNYRRSMPINVQVSGRKAGNLLLGKELQKDTMSLHQSWRGSNYNTQTWSPVQILNTS